MQPSIGSGPRGATVRPEFMPIVEGVDFVPCRVPREKVAAARELVERDGAVILTGWPVERDNVANAASAMLGTDSESWKRSKSEPPRTPQRPRRDRRQDCCTATAAPSSPSSTIAWCRSAFRTPTTF
ncbi:MAG: hypothetical protein ACRDTA_05925 [Pseudonocardiaceae bacterium]